MRSYTHNERNRRSIRLKGYDYSAPGFYFITICTYQMQHLFGSVKGGTVLLNHLGEIVTNEWHKTALIRDNVKLHEFIVMPNHIHGIIEIRNVDIESNSNNEASKISPDSGRDSLNPGQKLLNPVRAYCYTPVLDLLIAYAIFSDHQIIGICRIVESICISYG